MNPAPPVSGSAGRPDAIVVLCTVPADFDAGALATRLVKQSLAACVQVGPPVTSIYRWKGAVEKSAEKLLIIKASRHRFGAIESAIKAVHPYAVPEIIALDVSDGHAPYLAWIAAEARAPELVISGPKGNLGR